MSKAGHALGALCVGVIAVAAVPTPDDLVVAGLCFLASSLPDQAEIVVGYSWTNQRISLLPHRGITHTPWLWMLLAIGGAVIGGLAGAALCGVGLGALIHIMLDAMSPSGVPLVPGQPRWSLGPWRSGAGRYVYKTGTLSEFRVLVPLTAIAAVAGVIRWPAVAGAAVAAERAFIAAAPHVL